MTTLGHLASVPYCPMPSPSTDIEVTKRDGGTLMLRSRIMLGRFAHASRTGRAVVSCPMIARSNTFATRGR
jgi:hypothetical protein